MSKWRSVFLVGSLVAANLVLLFSGGFAETSGSVVDPASWEEPVEVRAWGECAHQCTGPGACTGFCYYMFEQVCSGDSGCNPPPPLQCVDCV